MRSAPSTRKVVRLSLQAAATSSTQSTAAALRNTRHLRELITATSSSSIVLKTSGAGPCTTPNCAATGPQRHGASGGVARADDPERPHVDVFVVAVRVDVLDGQLPAFLPRLGRRHHFDFELAVLRRDCENLRLLALGLVLEQCRQVRDFCFVEDRQLLCGQFLVSHEEDPSFELRCTAECRSERQMREQELASVFGSEREVELGAFG